MAKKLADMTQEERAQVDMCKCTHSRAAHAPFGGGCYACAAPGQPHKVACSRFDWSHYKEDDDD